MDWTNSPLPFVYDGARSLVDSLVGSLCSSPLNDYSPTYASGETDSGHSEFSPSIFAPSKIALSSNFYEKKTKRPVVFDSTCRDGFISSQEQESPSMRNAPFESRYFLTEDDKPYEIDHNLNMAKNMADRAQGSSLPPKGPLRIIVPEHARDIDDEPNYSYPIIGTEVPVTRSLLEFEESDPLDHEFGDSIVTWGQGNFYCVRDGGDGRMSVRVRPPGTPDHLSDPFSFENMTNRSMLDSPDGDDCLAISSIEKRKKFSDELSAFTSPLGHLRGDDGEDRQGGAVSVTPTQCKCKKSQCLKLYVLYCTVSCCLSSLLSHSLTYSLSVTHIYNFLFELSGSLNYSFTDQSTRTLSRTHSPVQYDLGLIIVVTHCINSICLVLLDRES